MLPEPKRYQSPSLERGLTCPRLWNRSKKRWQVRHPTGLNQKSIASWYGSIFGKSSISLGTKVANRIYIIGIINITKPAISDNLLTNRAGSTPSPISTITTTWPLECVGMIGAPSHVDHSRQPHQRRHLLWRR